MPSARRIITIPVALRLVLSNPAMAGVEYQEQEAYWASVGVRRLPTHPAVQAFARSKLAFIRDALGSDALTTQLRMLEVGAGNGYFSAVFQESFDLTCLDFSENMLRQNPLPADRKVVGRAEALPFADGAFDVVFCGNLLHHVEAPLDAVREMRRVATRYVVLLEPNAINPLMYLFGLLKKEERGTLKFTPGYLRRLGLDAGMRLRAFATQGTILPNKTPAALVPMLKPVERSWPLGFYNIAVFDV